MPAECQGDDDFDYTHGQNFSGHKILVNLPQQEVNRLETEIRRNWAKNSLQPWSEVRQTGQIRKLVCRVDAAAAPNLNTFSGNLPQLCEDNYPLIKTLSTADSFQPPVEIFLAFKSGLGMPAGTIGNRVTLETEYFTRFPDDYGAVVHELVHVAQSYPPNQQPGWLIEGMADSIRYKLGYATAWSKPSCESSGHYTKGYGCAAAFLNFIEKKYDRDVLPKINRVLRENRYNDSLFTGSTGHTLEQP